LRNHPEGKAIDEKKSKRKVVPDQKKKIGVAVRQGGKKKHLVESTGDVGNRGFFWGKNNHSSRSWEQLGGKEKLKKDSVHHLVGRKGPAVTANWVSNHNEKCPRRQKNKTQRRYLLRKEKTLGGKEVGLRPGG